MASYSKIEVVLVRFPFADMAASKVRPAVVVNAPHTYADLFVIPLTSRTASLQAGEFLMQDWSAAGLNVPTAVKRGIYTLHTDLVKKLLGRFSSRDAERLERSLREWLGL